jgi:F-type H+-transporting ATPase subunit epsilon
MFPLVVVTPTRLVFEGDARSFQVPGSEGYFQVLIGHIPMLASLTVGILTIQESGGERVYAMTGGFVEVLRQQATVLAETIERAEHIDVERARQAEARARARLASSDPDVDTARAQQALARALNRIRASEEVPR